MVRLGLSAWQDLLIIRARARTRGLVEITAIEAFARWNCLESFVANNFPAAILCIRRNGSTLWITALAGMSCRAVEPRYRGRL